MTLTLITHFATTTVTPIATHLITPLFIGTTEMVLIALVALLLFGGKKLPEMMRGLGLGIKEFKKASKEITEPIEEAKKEVMDNNEKEESPKA